MDILSSSPLYSQGTRLGEVWGLATCRREVLLNSDIHLAKSRAHPFYHEVPSFLILAVFSFPKVMFLVAHSLERLAGLRMDH